MFHKLETGYEQDKSGIGVALGKARKAKAENKYQMKKEQLYYRPNICK